MYLVVPLAGTWIEIYGNGRYDRVEPVVPLAGTWIEIDAVLLQFEKPGDVVPLAGTWIEIIKL